MSAMDSLKRAPRWTWYVVGGVGIGAGALRIWKGRAADPAKQTAADGSTVSDIQSGGVAPTTTGSSPPGVIIPPIITSDSGGDNASEMAGVFGTLFGGVFDDFTSLLGTVVAGDQANLATIIGGQQQVNEDIIAHLADAGPPPAPVMVNPSPVVVYVPPTPAPVTPHPPSAPPPPAPQYPTYGPDHHTLHWWRDPSNAKKGGQWKWPGEGNAYKHSHAFEGNQEPTGHTSNPNQ